MYWILHGAVSDSVKRVRVVCLGQEQRQRQHERSWKFLKIVRQSGCEVTLHHCTEHRFDWRIHYSLCLQYDKYANYTIHPYCVISIVSFIRTSRTDTGCYCCQRRQRRRRQKMFFKLTQNFRLCF